MQLSEARFAAFRDRSPGGKPLGLLSGDGCDILTGKHGHQRSVRAVHAARTDRLDELDGVAIDCSVLHGRLLCAPAVLLPPLRCDDPAAADHAAGRPKLGVGPDECDRRSLHVAEVPYTEHVINEP